MRFRSVFLGVVALAVTHALPALSQELAVWHDLGDSGIAWFQRLSDEFAKTHPGVSVKSLSYPTDQWFGRVISAFNTDTAPDLIFNNYERVIRIEDQTGKVMDQKTTLDPVADKAFLGEDDLRVATYRGKIIILPVQRVQMAFGIRKSWLDKVGETFPQSWTDMQRVAAKFRDADPEGSGQKTYPMALEAAKPRDLIHMLDLFIFGSGLRHTLIDPAGAIVIDEPAHARVLEEFLKIFTDYKYVAPDTINHSFAEMYQMIEGGRAGMFRVGDWNVKKWDSQAIKGDYVVGPWPKFDDTHENAVVIGGMRGIAVPENSPHKALAVEFAKFTLTKVAQQASLEMVGAAVRKDLDVGALSERGQFFAAPKGKLVAYDFPESVHAFYPELEAAYHRKLMGALANPPKDWKVFIAETAAEMRELSKTLAAK
jgi:multiple sugar transport system substrate-binding protein